MHEPVRRMRADDRREIVAVAARAFWHDPLLDFFSADLLHEYRVLPTMFGGVVQPPPVQAMRLVTLQLPSKAAARRCDSLSPPSLRRANRPWFGSQLLVQYRIGIVAHAVPGMVKSNSYVPVAVLVAVTQLLPATLFLMMTWIVASVPPLAQSSTLVSVMW